MRSEGGLQRTGATRRQESRRWAEVDVLSDGLALLKAPHGDWGRWCMMQHYVGAAGPSLWQCAQLGRPRGYVIGINDGRGVNLQCVSCKKSTTPSYILLRKVERNELRAAC